MIRTALPLAAAAMVAAPAAAAEIQIQANGPVVEMTVNENIEAEPDIANVSAGVSTRAQTAVAAMQQNAQAMSKVIARIKELGIADRDIQTSGINLGARYDYDQQSREQVFRGYEASNRVSVKLRDIQKTGEVLDALVAAGATDLGGPDWSIEDDSAARAQAREQAMATALAQAKDYARMAGYSGVRLLEINESVSYQQPGPQFRKAAAPVAAESTPVEPGMVQSGVTVTVKYEMTNNG
ncbi:hypothetical protein FHS61_002544 [Altererythrobacter atlanticus]|uniref:26 kDa periplasmic immunogenic protein n=1 Tax=Croceibacterium atlanticum TaxID=1267766 RepID=A0A0F7KT16_9SPHN|nr:SIMPL domain-containing protein [Croceibacterium atlanticum]AKH41925.1 26 kDa periplasmic immunogenic protein precursor [Croceibacterium atlanticum]MBB5733509.1 hypothetical protein [Croceibacterium atlanticum]